MRDVCPREVLAVTIRSHVVNIDTRKFKCALSSVGESVKAGSITISAELKGTGL